MVRFQNLSQVVLSTYIVRYVRFRWISVKNLIKSADLVENRPVDGF
jgi:hypothetical protein